MTGANALQQVEQDFPDAGATGVEEIVLGGNNTEDNSLDQLDAMFSELENMAPSQPTNEGITVVGTAGAASQTPAPAVTEGQLIEAGNAAALEEMKNKALEELDEQSSPSPDNVQTPEPNKKPKRISTVGMAKSEALATTLGDKLDELLTIDTKDLAMSDEDRFDKRLALLEQIDKMPKKIGEKATNLFGHLARGAALSNYTRIALNFLVQNDELSSKQLKDAYLARPYSEGTSSSQCTQLMHLLPALGIAIKSGGRLIPNPTSTLLPLLIAMKQPGPTTGPVETPEDSE